MNRENRKMIASEVNAAVDSQGKVTPDAVVERASNKRNPLHGLFEWDDKKAGHAHRLDQARALIRSVRVEIHTTVRTVKVVGYVRDPDAGKDQGYIETARLKTDTEKAAEAIEAELKRARAAMSRARDLASALDMEDLLDDLLANLDGIALRILKAA